MFSLALAPGLVGVASICLQSPSSLNTTALQHLLTLQEWHLKQANKGIFFLQCPFGWSWIYSAEQCLHLFGPLPCTPDPFPVALGRGLDLGRGFPWPLQPETSLQVNSHSLLISRAKLGQAVRLMSYVRFHMQGAASAKRPISVLLPFSSSPVR